MTNLKINNRNGERSEIFNEICLEIIGPHCVI